MGQGVPMGLWVWVGDGGVGMCLCAMWWCVCGAGVFSYEVCSTLADVEKHTDTMIAT